MKPRSASRKRGRLLPLLCLLLPTMQGCASSATDPPPAAIVKGNSFCDIAEKVTWSTKDTPSTINGVRREAAKIDRVCKAKAPG